MRIDDIPELVELLIEARTDTWNVEAKDARRGLPDTTDETLSAFANMPEGGIIVFGLAEVDGEFQLVGVSDAKVIAAGVAAKARERIHPPVQLGAVDIASIGGKEIVACVVPPQPSDLRPFRVGIHGPAFTRSGDGDYKLSEQEELYLVSQRAQPIHDRAPVEGASVQRDLVPELLDQYLEAQLNESHRLRSMDREELLIRTNVIDHETGFPTVAAIYAMGIHPQQFLPHLTVKAHARPDAGQSSALRLTDKTEFSGPVPDLLDAVTDWVHKHLMHGIAFHQGHGFNAPELPAVAVREVVANALVHRDLSPASFGSFPMVVKLPAKLIVENPGGLWGLTEQELGKTSPRARNAILYRMCSAITTPSGRRVIEGHATGIPEVRRVLREAFLPEPFFKDEVIKFRALLSSSTMLDTDALSWISSLPGGEHFTVAQKHALIAMKKGNEITNAAYRSEFPMDSVQARDELQQLVHFGLVRKTGAGRSTAYELQTDPVQPSFAFDTLPTPNRSPADIVLTALRSRATPVSRKQLIADTGLTDAQTYRVLRHLEDQGSVATDKDPADGRIVRYFLASNTAGE
ncbi:ATP-binding protein [Corynebacterium breve]|uniref:ATP-binding protein n=1 Tax=Corynebacterium breve TaxID=3049799 RepID=A0ABY8VHA1_9CORY|nr:ATP-binding protein [Corynebacterium breve]WIM67638.1 ATP-binding protein [Corynebacterium breve]